MKGKWPGHKRIPSNPENMGGALNWCVLEYFTRFCTKYVLDRTWYKQSTINCPKDPKNVDDHGVWNSQPSALTLNLLNLLPDSPESRHTSFDFRSSRSQVLDQVQHFDFRGPRKGCWLDLRKEMLDPRKWNPESVHGKGSRKRFMERDSGKVPGNGFLKRIKYFDNYPIITHN